MAQLRDGLQTLQRTMNDSKVPLETKVLLLKEIATAAFPPESLLCARIIQLPDSPKDDDKSTKKELDALYSAAHLLLPFYSPAPTPDIRQDIETEVRLCVNEKFTKSPYFLAVSAILAFCLTLFCFGLFNLNHDVKDAAKVVSDMQKQVTESMVSINNAQAEAEKAINARTNNFNEQAKTSATRIEDAEKSLKGTIDSKFKTEIADIREAKKTATDQMASDSRDVSKTATDANKSIADARDSAVRKLENGVPIEVERIHQRGTELVNNLQKPTWKDMVKAGFRLNWPFYAGLLVCLALSSIAIAIARSR